ncbi:small GTPase [Tieghemostelium lacteum]|uniref:small monomeric GTPase n=1 Tax=Tieghemostelium lacteum TaxID=361077 RepID=A0A151Z5X3_TIELA|nr:small GTPase [Tieghemostelium lacteum]|eukprot:KYQ89337.1 small GTPase [Tieghemostelium lacteum]
MGLSNSKKKGNSRKDSNSSLKDGTTKDGARRENSFIDGRQYKLVMLGIGGVGKSSVSMRFVQGQFTPDYDPTIEDAYVTQHEIDGKHIKIEILDTAGQEFYTSGVHDKVFRIGEGFVLVYSITSRESFEKIKDIREKILWARDTESIPMIIVGNKNDIERERKVSVQEGKDLARDFNCPFLETSAKTNNNITECINTILREVIKS